MQAFATPEQAFHEALKAKGGVDLGTSIMACRFNGGVVCGSDSRTSTGSYVANRITDKLTQLTPNIYVCRSGSSADTQILSDYVRYFLEMHSLELDNRCSVYTAAHMLGDLAYQYKEQMQTSFLVAGVDSTGPHIFCVPLGSPVIEEPWSIGGSGSSYIYGHCDATYRENMTQDECIQFVTNALSLAMQRDGSSGGVIRLAVMTNDFKVERRLITDPPSFSRASTACKTARRRLGLLSPPALSPSLVFLPRFPLFVVSAPGRAARSP
ncbi:putative Proteasome subunit beta type-6 [Paratrimastix pyriformis]|uniref:proteasome endopeptidase complex n=1 Tax=Paratrimastix pyriformis TaxID=342808 RepID=A0ABQ8UHD8_9EUKA|nr:putative Proteasome subunit beta type-6 [Paratrimastix pyriformis]